MHSIIIRLRSEEGNLTIIAFVLLVVLTLIGIFATRTAQIDMLTAYNEVPYKQNFYVAEGGVNREAAELGRGMYPVNNVSTPQTLATQASGSLPGPAHNVLGKPTRPSLSPCRSRTTALRISIARTQLPST
jgi:Tfp pilus assembly protein PilX